MKMFCSRLNPLDDDKHVIDFTLLPSSKIRLVSAESNTHHQKVRNASLAFGDKNTKFYHTFIILLFSTFITSEESREIYLR